MHWEQAPIGYHFIKSGLSHSQAIPPVSPSRVNSILEQIGIPLDEWDTITLPREVMQRLQK